MCHALSLYPKGMNERVEYDKNMYNQKKTMYIIVLGRLWLFKKQSISIDFGGKCRGFDFDFDFFGSHN